MMLEILVVRQAAEVASAGEMDEGELPFELAERSPPQLLYTSVQEKGGERGTQGMGCHRNSRKCAVYFFHTFL